MREGSLRMNMRIDLWVVLIVDKQNFISLRAFAFQVYGSDVYCICMLYIVYNLNSTVSRKFYRYCHVRVLMEQTHY